MGILRILLALAVVITHAPVQYMRLTLPGDTAVQAFYIISGFYMAFVMDRKYNFPGATRIFYQQRYLRLAPMYWVAVLLTLGVGVAFSLVAHRPMEKLEIWAHTAGHASIPMLAFLCISQATMLGLDSLMFLAASGNPLSLHFTLHWANETLPAVRFILVPPAWSLSVELLFYLVAPFIVRRSLRFQWTVLAASFALRIACGLGLGLTTDPWNNRFFPFEAGLFVAGSIAYRWLLPRMETVVQTKRFLRPVVTLGIGVMIFSYSKIPLHPELRHWGFLLAVMLATPMLFAATQRDPVDRKIGEMSYPLYLLHQVALVCVEPLVRRLHGVPHDFVILLVPLTVAAAAYYFLEEHFESWRERLFRQQHGNPEIGIPAASAVNPPLSCE